MPSDVRPVRRVRATAAEWARIREAKLGPCRVCDLSRTPYLFPSTLHHLVSKSLGGSDVEDNLVPLCGTGTTGCHGLIEEHNPWACTLLGQRLTEAERAYVIGRKGAYYLERRYGVKEIAGMSDTDMAYIAVRKNCPCVVAAMVDRPEYAKGNAQEISKLIRQGYVIERVTVPAARERTWAYPCEHELAAKAGVDPNQMMLA